MKIDYKRREVHILERIFKMQSNIYMRKERIIDAQLKWVLTAILKFSCTIRTKVTICL